jgi:hypothetical protein
MVSFPSKKAWAVGFSQPPTVAPSRTVALHDDGAGWVQVPTPNPAPGSNRLDAVDAVDAVAADDVWAVGSGTRRGGSRGGTLNLSPARADA